MGPPQNTCPAALPAPHTRRPQRHRSSTDVRRASRSIRLDACAIIVSERWHPSRRTIQTCRAYTRAALVRYSWDRPTPLSASSAPLVALQKQCGQRARDVCALPTALRARCSATASNQRQPAWAHALILLVQLLVACRYTITAGACPLGEALRPDAAPEGLAAKRVWCSPHAMLGSTVAARKKGAHNHRPHQPRPSPPRGARPFFGSTHCTTRRCQNDPVSRTLIAGLSLGEAPRCNKKRNNNSRQKGRSRGEGPSQTSSLPQLWELHVFFCFCFFVL